MISNKDKLIEWSKNTCYLYNTCCISMLEKAVLLTEQIDQQSIIELQQKVIELKNSDLNSFQTVSVGVQDLLCGGFEDLHNSFYR